MQSCELHLHTEIGSLLDGLNNPEEYMQRASELGMTHLAVTDHGSLSAHREFQIQAKNFGITPVLGCEMYISGTDRFDRRAVKKRDDNTQAYNHLTVLAKDAKGYENLNRLSEIAWTEGFYSKPRIDMEILEEYQEGLIVLSGCLNGLIAKAIEKDLPVQADTLTAEFKRIFGDRFFMEIQGHNPPDINSALLEYARKHRVKPVVTSDCHYARKEDLWYEQAMLIISSKPKKNPEADFTKSQKMDLLDRFNYLFPNRMMNFEEYEIYLRSYEEHQALLAKQGIGEEPIRNTMEVANMVGEYPFYEGLDLLPQPAEGDAQKILEDLVWKGMAERGLMNNPVAVDRVKEELSIIGAKNFAPYFLPLIDTIHWCHEQGIRVGPGRGSGAGSLSLYALRVTEVNPLDHNLLFFRFINPERNDFPDVDSDVEVHRRSEVKSRMLREYKHVASIATFGRFQGKSCVKRAASVFLVPLGEVNKALKGADWQPPLDWWEEWGRTEHGRAFMKKYPEVIKLAKYLYGRVSQVGMHAGGLVLSKEPIAKYAPMQSAVDGSDPAKNRIPLVALDMNDVGDIGLIKYDLLGLSALTIISDTLNMIKERTGEDIDLNALTYDDPGIYSVLSEGHTKGVFQCDAVPYTNLLLKMGVSNFDELVATNALVRPGAANSTAGAEFIARRKGEKPVGYVHDVVKPFTQDTYGVIIYQEQVMLAMTELAGMSMSEADKVRKIIGKKRDVKEFEEYREKFITGASTKVPKQIAERLWRDFEAHAGYSFNKSHAVAYSMVSYWTAWLKNKYPLEYMTALLKFEDSNDKRLEYLMECKRLGLRIMLPHVNESGVNFEIGSDERGDFIRFGLSNIKGIAERGALKLMESRPYRNYEHLAQVVGTKYSGINITALKAMNAIGAATFEDNPRTGTERDNFYEILSIPAFDAKGVPPRILTQLRTLDEYTEDETFICMGMVRGIKSGPGWSRVDIIDEKANVGIFADEHTGIEKGTMYVLLVANNRIARYVSVKDLSEDNGGEFQQFLETMEFPDIPEGMLRVVSFKSRTTKAGKKMADVVFSDAEKNLNSALVFPGNFMMAYSRLKEGTVVDVVLNTTKDGALFVENVL